MRSARLGHKPRVKPEGDWQDSDARIGLRVTASPAPRARPRRFPSPERIGGPPAVSGSLAARERTASPARSGSVTRRGDSEISASNAREDLRQTALQVLSEPAQRERLYRT